MHDKVKKGPTNCMATVSSFPGNLAVFRQNRADNVPNCHQTVVVGAEYDFRVFVGTVTVQFSQGSQVALTTLVL